MKKVKVTGYYLLVSKTKPGEPNIAKQFHNLEGTVVKQDGDRVFVDIEDKIYNLPKRILTEIE